MFADYSRYTRSARDGALAVFSGLGVTSLWLMSLGFVAASAASSLEPAAMLAAVGLGASGGLLMAFGTVTTNFVNIYLSALALKSLRPATTEQSALWVTGLVGAGFSLASRAWLEGYAGFMQFLGGVFTPVGGVLLARYFLLGRAVRVDDLYDARGPYSRRGGFVVPGVAGWVAGAVAYAAGAGWLGESVPPELAVGGTFPSLLAAALTSFLAFRLSREG
jgi:purine-cytosine permease-like protein